MASVRRSPSRGRRLRAGTRGRSWGSPQQRGELPPRAKEQELDAAGFESQDLSDLVVRRALSIREPEHLALHRLQMFHRPREIGALLRARGGAIIGGHFIVQGNQLGVAFAPRRVAREIRGDAEERVAPVRLAFVSRTGAIETVIRLL